MERTMSHQKWGTLSILGGSLKPILLSLLEFRPVKRAIGIDPGVQNFIVVKNNCGTPNVLGCGAVLKSIVQLYDKLISSITSEEMDNLD